MIILTFTSGTSIVSMQGVHPKLIQHRVVFKDATDCINTESPPGQTECPDSSPNSRVSFRDFCLDMIKGSTKSSLWQELDELADLKSYL